MATKPRTRKQGPTQKRAPAKKTGPGIGQGKRGQRLAAGLTSYVSPNIGGEQPVPFGGAYDSGDVMQRVARNEYLNTLSIADRERAMAQMGYFTGGVPQAVPKSSKQAIREYAKQGGFTAPGTYLMPNRGGQFDIDAEGNLVKGSVEAFRPAKGKRVGPEKGKGKGKGKNKPKSGGTGGGYLGGGGAGAGDAEAAATAAAAFVPYAEADTSTTSYRRAQGKAYGRGSGEGLAGQTSSPEGESAVVEEAAAGGGGKRPRKRRARKLTRRAKSKQSLGGKTVTARERKRIQAAKKK